MDQEHKRVYETTFIVNATLDDAQIDQIIDRFKDFLVKNGSEVRNMDKWGRKRLAYPIQKKNNGFYTLCEFSGGADITSKLERYYALDENIMRFLTVQLSDKLLKARQEQERRAQEQAPTPVPTPAPPPPVEPKPIASVLPPGAHDNDEDEDDAT